MKKPKCPYCGAKGHDGDACPKKSSSSAIPVIPTVISGAGSGISHKTSRKASSTTVAKEDTAVGDLPEGLSVDNDNPYFVFDAGCDVGASIDGLAILLKLPERKCVSAYNTAISTPLYGGAICRQYIKANKPWKKNAPRVTTMLEADSNLFFVIGLGHAFLDGDDDADDDDDADHEQFEEQYNAAVDALVDALDEDDRVVGFCAKLDYAADCLARTSADTQLRRLKATCQAALQEGVPVQIRVGTVEDDETHLRVIKDLAKVLLEVVPEEDEDHQKEAASHPPLQIHLSCWTGKSETMMKLLAAFPDTLYIGMNPTVGFAKAAVAHECAFEVPLNRLLLETDNVIPAPVAKSMGRKAFSHSALVSYCAIAVAEPKKISPEQVARAASENTIRLYGKGLVDRARQAVEEASARVAKQKQLDKELAEEEAAAAGGEIDNEQIESKQKKKKKKKGKVEVQKDDSERSIDDDILASMLMDAKMGP
jgi:Tat protein secretion system quality control protein TatD with DNase activity